LPIPAAVSNVSQKTTGPPSCIPQFEPVVVGVMLAKQLAVVPPLEPLQFHAHGPEPATDDAAPAEQKLVEGADDTIVPLADPHMPLTAAGVPPPVTKRSMLVMTGG